MNEQQTRKLKCKKFNVFAYLKRIWTGTSSKKEYLVYFVIVLAIYFTGVILAASVYPEEFSMREVYISYLGGYPNNPDGYMIYNTCEFIAGFLLIPHFVYLLRNIWPTAKLLNVITALFGIIGCIGFALIAIWHQGTPGDGHSITTWLAFGGFGGAAFFMFFLLIRKMMLKDSWPKWYTFLLLYGSTFAILITTLLLENYSDWFIALGLDPAYTSGKFMEWMYFFTVFDWLIFSVLVTPGLIKD
ncbi:MAG: hypothetical protein GF364_18205 [Candidatus Lokiarchaeota archaeon]|nr:hypothetical protein [Candidatus Lokiarchaeota archaeon]